MPYVNVTVGKSLTEMEKAEICKIVSNNISVIRGKTAAATMVSVTGEADMFMNNERKVCVFCELRLFGKAEKEEKAELTQILGNELARILDAEKGNIYINFAEFGEWGTGTQLTVDN
ncbi:MAG: hypothetical protein LBL09_01040 [Oscillospiraceae bacterium]|jgi:phenylpyruvate tautomerase PptA (4-oxalocrotonate tautomerase family)|nr:hypothetical protein [Oscillospiraceae bacterium]